MKTGFVAAAYICLVNIIYIVLLFVTTIRCSTTVVTARPVRFLPVQNPVMELTITISTADTVHSPDTAHTQHLQNCT
jgi:uncharacterized protein YebE (UPF0316 family)